mmetsp:Transcript_51960/g.134394  ORF Transcript_51960/g.134394 Transcript_51960/m.134394 type:complete len:535 (+) Transcript_51960:44-1648(+)
MEDGNPRVSRRMSQRQSLSSKGGHFMKTDVPDQDEIDGVGAMLIKAKARIMSLMGEAVPKTAEDQQMSEMTAIIRMYRGIAEEDEDDTGKHWVDKPAFDVTMSILIIFNTIVIGLEVDFANPASREVWWVLLEALFCIVFLVEVFFKIYYHSCKWIIWDVWNVITFVVAMITLFAFIASFSSMGMGSIRMISLIRVAGLVRLTRLIRRYKALEELRLVVQGLVESFQTIAWTVILATVFIYICAVLLTKQIGHNTDTYGTYRKLSGGWDHEEYFGTVGRSMYTLLQAMTLDSWSSKIARHTIANQWYMTAFWIFFLLVSTFGIMNIVVSVIVELMLTASQNNEKRLKLREDRTRRAELESIKEIFRSGDEDRSNSLDLDEFLKACKKPEVQMRMRQLELPLSDAAKLFGVIDEDGSRSLSFNEFITGCMKLKGPAQSKELLAIQAHADSLAKKMDILSESLADSERMMAALDEVTARISKRFDMAVLGSRRKIAHSVGGTSPMKPYPREGPGGDEAPLSIGNRPALPLFPDLLR